jgi:hypothetical protein
MIAIGLLFVRMLCDFFKPRPRLEAEILILRHQLNVLQQRTPRRRLHLRWVDRALSGCRNQIASVFVSVSKRRTEPDHSGSSSQRPLG